MHTRISLESSDRRHEIFIAKIVAIVVLLVSTIICGGIPFLLNRCFNLTKDQPNSRSTKFVNFLLQLSGGVLLATTFLHLLPSVQELVDNLEECGVLKELPFSLPETLMCCGFFLIYLIEALVGLFIKKRAQKLKAIEDIEKMKSGSYVSNTKQEDCTIECEEETEDFSTPRSLSGLLIVVALSLHEIFEGMAIGLENTTSSVWIMFGGVAAHKLVLAFCLGVEFLVSRISRTLSMVYVIVFAIITPIGIGIGILLSHYGFVTTSSLSAVILQGIACGTLLYVVFFEIWKKHQINLMALLAIFIGFAIMFGLQMFDDDGDNTC